MTFPRVDELSRTRTIFDEDHHTFRAAARAFISKEVVPHYLDWEAARLTPREMFADAGKYGFIGMAVPEQYGGGGTDDFRFNQVVSEEFAYAGIGGSALGVILHNDIVTPYFVEYCNGDQAARWLPGVASGELITAIAMSEPGAGSDLAGIATSAVLDGDEYVLNGTKTFITNGINSDLVVVAARTESGDRRSGLTLMVVERGMDGFQRGRNLEKVGLHSQDTAELFFADVRVPVANVLGSPGRGFDYLTHNLAQERLSIALSGVATARAALVWTLEYVEERKAFGKSIASFQNTKFVLAEVKTEIDVAQAYIDQCVIARNAGKLDPAGAAQAKLWCTQLQQRVIDKCLQLFGGYGYMIEYPIARTYADARVTQIYGGTSEIMKTIIAKSLGL